jgi:hypothetical protein
MQQKLKKHSVRSLEEEDDEDAGSDFDEDIVGNSENKKIDPRWEKLKEISNQ